VTNRIRGKSSNWSTTIVFVMECLRYTEAFFFASLHEVLDITAH